MIHDRIAARLPHDVLARARALSVIEASFAQVMTSLTSGAALTGFALLLGATPMHIGLMASLPAFACLAQITAPYWTQRLGSRRAVATRTLAISRTQWLLIALLPLLPLAFGLKAPLLVAILTVAGALAAIGNTAWFSWMGDIVPRSMRQRYFANRNLALGIISLALGPLIGYYLDLPLWRTADGRPGTMGFMLLLVAGTLVGWSSIGILRRIVEPAQQSDDRVPLRQQMRLPWREPNVRGFIIYRAIWALVVGICGNFFTVYLIQQLGLSYSLIYALTTYNALIQLVSYRFLAVISDRVSAKTMLMVSTVGKGIFAIVYAFTTATNLPLLFVVHSFGLFEAGLNLSTNTMLLNVTPRQNSTAHIATYSAVVNVCSAISPLIGGILIAGTQGLHLDLAGFSFVNYQVLFLISGVGRTAMVLLTPLFREQPPGADAEVEQTTQTAA
jgi:MFS family permease